MPHKVATTFDADGPQGLTVFDKFHWSDYFCERLLQKRFINNTAGHVPTLTSLTMSYGHTMSSINGKSDMHDSITCREEAGDRAEFLNKLDSEFLAMNDPSKSYHQRLKLWQTKAPGYILALVGGKGRSLTGIGCIACPVLSEIDMSDPATLGAPVWTDILDHEICETMGVGEDVATHYVVGSLAHNTWDLLGRDREDFLDGLMPVVMPEGKALGNKPAGSAVFQVLFIPQGGEAPVGLFFKPTTTYDDYVAGLENSVAYKNYIHLLKKHGATFESWFESCNARSMSMKTTVLEAAPLWEVTSNPHSSQVKEPEQRKFFTVPQEILMRSVLDNAILRASNPTVENDMALRCGYRVWRDRAAACYPLALGGGQRPDGRLPFLDVLLPPKDGWTEPLKTWLSVLAVDPTLGLPSPYVDYDPVEVPTTPVVPAGWSVKRLTLEPTTTDDPLAAFKRAVASPEALLGASVENTTPAAPRERPGHTAAVTDSVPNDKNARRDRLREAMANTPGLDDLKSRLDFDSPQEEPFGFGANNETAIELSPERKKKKPRVGFESSQDSYAKMASSDNWGPQGYESPALGKSPSSDQNYQHGYESTFDPFNQGWIFQENGTLAKAKHISMTKARLFPKEERAKCSRTFFQLCLMNTSAIDVSRRMGTRTIKEVDPADYVYVQPPTDSGRRFLTGFDHGNKGKDAAAEMTAALAFRWKYERSFYPVSMPYHDWKAKITPEFVTRAYSIFDWRMDSDQAPPTPSEKKHSLLSFLPMVDASYTSQYIPLGGVPRQHMIIWIRFIYFFYSMPYCDSGARQMGYDTRHFDQSLFGQALKLMCQLIQQGPVERLWQARQEPCTVNFVRDVSELFEMIAEFVQFRSGANGTPCGIEEAMFERNRKIYMVAPAVMLPDELTSFNDSLVDKISEYKTRMLSRWKKGRFDVDDYKWAKASESPLLQSRPTQKEQLYVEREPGDRNPRGRGRQYNDDDGPKLPFKASVPIFEYIGSKSVSSGRQLKDVIIPAVGKGQFPHLVYADDPGGKPLKHSLCLTSNFVGYCFCPNTRSCRTQFPFRGYSRHRAHVDLADSKWSSAVFDESKWDSVVSFLKKHDKLIKPTEAFKQLTPSTQW